MIKRKKRPTIAGLYTEKSVVGSAVKINSARVVQGRELRGFYTADQDQEYNISGVRYRVDHVGNIRPVFTLETDDEVLANEYFTPDQLWVTEILPSHIKVERIKLSIDKTKLYAGSEVEGVSRLDVEIFPEDAENKDVEFIFLRGKDLVRIEPIDGSPNSYSFTALGPGEVFFYCKSIDGSEIISNSILISIEELEIVKSISTYNIPVVDLSYNPLKVPFSGGTLQSVVHYVQHRIREDYYNDGTMKIDEKDLRSGGTVSFTKLSGIADMDPVTGDISYYVQSTSFVDVEVAHVKCSVSMNGKTGESEEFIAYQEHYAVALYIGQITATRSEFRELTDSELISNATRYLMDGDYLRQEFTINNSIWYMIIPEEGVYASEAEYTAAGITSKFSEDEITNPEFFSATHSKIYIEGVPYVVYGNRNTALVDSDSRGSITFKTREQ